MHVYILIAAGSALGGLMRAFLQEISLRYWSDSFPLGILIINVLGSFCIGLAAALLTSIPARAFVMAGLCGGFTTFSAFSLQTLELFQQGDIARAAANIALSVVLCIAAAWAGQYAAGLAR